MNVVGTLFEDTLCEKGRKLKNSITVTKLPLSRPQDEEKPIDVPGTHHIIQLRVYCLHMSNTAVGSHNSKQYM